MIQYLPFKIRNKTLCYCYCHHIFNSILHFNTEPWGAESNSITAARSHGQSWDDCLGNQTLELWNLKQICHWDVSTLGKDKLWTAIKCFWSLSWFLFGAISSLSSRLCVATLGFLFGQNITLKLGSNVKRWKFWGNYCCECFLIPVEIWMRMLPLSNFNIL